MSIVTDLGRRALWPVVNAVSAVGAFYTELNPATLSGAIDVIVIEQPDGELTCTPFHVRFGKLKLLRPSDKVVEMQVNGTTVVDIPMKVGEAGEAFFVVETDNPVPSEYATSPIVTPAQVNADESFEFQLNPLDGEVVGAVTDLLDSRTVPIGERVTTAENQTEVDATLDMENLHIGTSYTGNDNGEIQKFDEELVETEKGIPFDNRGRLRFEMDIAEKSQSPPMSWAWGSFPQKSKDGWQQQNQEKLRKRQSTPLMSAKSLSPELRPFSVKEKVDTYLSNLPSMEDSRKIAIEQELTDEILELMVLNEEDPSVSCSLCGPIFEFQKTTTEEIHHLFDTKKILFEKFLASPDLLSNPNVIVKVNGYYHSWATAGPIIMSQVLFQQPLPINSLRGLLQLQTVPKSSWFSWRRTSTAPIALKHKQSEPMLGKSPQSPSLASTTVIEKAKPLYAKSLRLTSDQLKSLNLVKGSNTVKFSVNDRAVCNARIFFWSHDVNIVISDVDGTITKSDVLGHVFTMVGKDWTHAGVANYYSNIAKNGYQFLYLTSRAIGQANYTREYLAGVEQDQYQLPEGPVLLSPDRLVQAFTREVIQRRPQEFKIACLKDVKRLFGDLSPFYAGFGNRITDAISYRAVDVPPSRIFTIDPTGEVKLELLANYKTSYVKLNETVDQLFPPTKKVLDPEYNDFEYWKPSLPPLDIDLEHGKEESEYATDEGEVDDTPLSAGDIDV